MITNIIWDVGGTMFDTYPATTRALLDTLAEQGITAPADWVRSLAHISQQHAAHTLAQIYHLDEHLLWERYRARMRAAPPEQQPPFPGVAQVCEAVVARGGLNLIATHRERALAENLLSAHRLKHLFAAVYSTSDGYPRKPDPAMLDDLALRFDLDRARTLALGDREIDIQAGQAAGMRTALFGLAVTSLRPDFTIQHHSELLPLLA
jgi:HAD superfamily hydrolase (TIGR01509 family)